MKNIFSTLMFLVICSFVLVLSLRGIVGNPTPETINSNEWKDEGPIELSPERGRFALLVSMVENRSFEFSLPIARFATPDLGYIRGHYVSLFAPGISFIAFPGYAIGKLLNAAQVGAYATIAIFAIMNAFLIREIARLLGAHSLLGSLGGITFLFASPAFTYAVSFFQHHISTFLILASIYLLLRFKGTWTIALVFFFAALSMLVDYPNLILIFPVCLYALNRIVTFESIQTKLAVRVNIAGLFMVLTMLAPLAFFFWFNKTSYGNPWQLSGTLVRVKAIDEAGNPAKPADAGKDAALPVVPKQNDKSAVGFFMTRNLRNGFYIHFLSPDRGILSYTPIVLFGVLAIPLLYRKHPKELALFLSIIGADILLYSMWDDPYGGWAFGSRYLIPSYALLSIFIAVALNAYHKKMFIFIVFFLLFEYSLIINTLGALTSSRNPPQVEVLSLEKLSGKEEKYTYGRNIEMLQNNRIKSFVWQTFLVSSVHAWQYYQIVLISVSIPAALYLISFYIDSKKTNEKSD